MRRPSRCHGPETNRTVPNRVEYEPEPEPNSTWPGLAWQQVADAVADDHEDHRRDRSVAPKTGDTSCVNKPLTRWRLRCDSGAVAATAYQLDALNGNFFFFGIHETVLDYVCVCVCVDQRSFCRIVRKQLLLFIQEWALQHYCLALLGLSHLMCESDCVGSST